MNINSSKQDNRFFSAELARALNDVNAAIICQQLHYWLQKDVGVIVDQTKWIYNSFESWVKTQFQWMSVWQFRQSMKKLRELKIVKVIRYRAKEWKQTNYYTLDYERLEEFLKSQSAESIEISDLCDSTNRDVNNSHLEMEESSKSYITKNTSTKKHQTQNPHPTRPQKSGGEKKNIASQEKENSQAKSSFSKPGLDQVLARPKKTITGLEQKAVEPDNRSARVDEKINQNKYTEKIPVQESVQNLAGQETLPQPDVQEPVRVQSKPKPKPKKTPKGTKPKKTYSKALWSTKEQLEQFRKALTVALVNGVGNARNITALVSYVINLITQGHSHIYWEEWSAGLEIGSSERHEWEAAPGQPYPKFVEYLVEKLIYPSESRSQALFRVGKILKDKTQARLYWRDFKRVIEVLRQDAEKAHAEGKQVALPVWFIERAEISLERAADSAQKVSQLAPEQTDWINNRLPESEKLLSGAGNLSLPGVEEQELAVTPDPWADDDDGDFCFNDFIDLSYLEQQARKVAANPGKLSLLLVDFKSAFSQANKNQREKIRSAIAPICPELLNFL